MKNTKYILVAGISLMSVLLTSCSITLPSAVSDAKVGTKVGKSSTLVIGAYYVNSNYGVTDAVKNGKITGGVASIDTKVTNYIFVQKREIIVTGE